MSDDSTQPPSPSNSSRPMSLLVLAGTAVLALFCCCSGSLSTALFSLESEDAGVAAGFVSGPAIGFGLGALAGGLISHFAFKDKSDALLFRVGIPVVSAFVGAIGLGILTVVFFGFIWPEL